MAYNVYEYAMFAVAERRQIWAKEIAPPLKIKKRNFLNRIFIVIRCNKKPIRPIMILAIYCFFSTLTQTQV